MQDTPLITAMNLNERKNEKEVRKTLKKMGLSGDALEQAVEDHFKNQYYKKSGKK